MPSARCIAEQGGLAAIGAPAAPYGSPGLAGLRARRPVSGFRRRRLGWDEADWSNSRPSRGRFPLPCPPRGEGGRAMRRRKGDGLPRHRSQGSLGL